jgi:molybdenum cofactor cytidylyltransferase
VASDERLAVALLAAGRSTRFGDANKLTALLGGRPLIDWAAQAGLAVDAHSRFIVTGPGDLAPIASYERMINPHPERGMAGSLRVAAQAAERAGTDALLVLLADVPFVEAAHLQHLIERHRVDPERPVFSIVPRGATQPPALFPASCFAALQALEGDKGARALAADAVLVETETDSLLDIDTPDDLDRAKSRL